MKDQVGFAIVGTGSIADFHARAMAELSGARLHAVHSRDPGRSAEFAARHSATADVSLAALLRRPEVDVVCITTPSGAHEEVVLPALAAGKHVLCEKPLEISTSRIDRMLAEAKSRGRFLGVVLPARFGDGACAVKAAVEQGRFGRLTLCSAYVKWWRTDDYYRSGKWRGTWALDGGGALMNQGIHAVDLLIWLAGIPDDVKAFAGTLAHAGIEVEDTLAASLHFAHGALGSIECATSCSPGSSRRIEICGTRGSATLEEDKITRWEFDAPRPEDAALLKQNAGATGGSGAADPRALGIVGHKRVIADMIDAVQNTRPPAVTGEEGRKSVALIEQIYASALGKSPGR
ncbi:MAG: oxidoreductase domain protein [Verrucomicrobia bacterium]|nr:oxidoreductase domain protein [Verrucomicrobiota bacterium]